MAKKTDGNGSDGDTPEEGKDKPKEGKFRTIQGGKSPEDKPPQTDSEKLTEAMGVMFDAFEKDIEPDLSRFDPPPAARVEQAVNSYRAKHGLDVFSDRTVRSMMVARMLFYPGEEGQLKENIYYRQHTQPLPVTMNYPDHLLPNYRDPFGNLDHRLIEHDLRRLDTTLRHLDPVERDEVLLSFMHCMLDDSYGGVFDAHAKVMKTYGLQLDEKSSELLRQLTVFYDELKQLLKQLSGILRNSAAGHLNEEELNEIIENGDRAILMGSGLFGRGAYADKIRYISPFTLVNLKSLTTALMNCLPSEVAGFVRIQMNTTYRADTVEDDSTLLTDASRDLRKAYIALSRGHGSYESFFSAMYKQYKLVQDNYRAVYYKASMLVSVYDSLGLPIAATLRESRERLLNGSRFGEF